MTLAVMTVGVSRNNYEEQLRRTITFVTFRTKAFERN
jgi:hypothetical protein